MPNGGPDDSAKIGMMSEHRSYFLVGREWLGLPRLITTADIELRERRLYPFVVTAILPYEAKSNGLPAGRELDRCSRIEDSIEAALKPFRPIHVGHITGNKMMTAVFYTGLRCPTSITAKVNVFKKVAIQLECREDPHWKWFTDEMELTEIEKEESRSRELLTKLAEMGDIASKPRPVDFGINFPSSSFRDAFLEEVLANGYRTGQPNWTSDGKPELFWCELVRETTINPEAIAGHCAYLRKVAQSHGGDLDGWATPLQ